MANFDQDIWNWFMSRVYDRSKIEIEKFDFETAFLSKMTYFVKTSSWPLKNWNRKFQFWVVFSSFVFMGRRLRKFSLRLRKLRARENWIRQIELDLNPINEKFFLFSIFEKILKLKLLILNDWIILTFKWIWLLLISSKIRSLCIYVTVSMRSNHWVVLFQKYDHPGWFYELAVIRNQIVPWVTRFCPLIGALY